jgi:RsmE family RNA methyltransferase
LLIGPEGGLTDEEQDELEKRQVIRWSLGEHRLRAETAGVVGVHRLAVALGQA